MIQTIIQIEGSLYPFDEIAVKGQILRIEDMQHFSNIQDLQEKKNEMIKKNKLIDNSYIIKLLKIYQEELSLHYMYEHVPYSFGRYIKKNYKTGKQHIIQMSAKLFFKKITYELAMLISYLSRMRIEIDLSINNIGLTEDEKLKVFMNSRCRMGHKTEVSLVAFYSSRKEKIISYLENQFEEIRQREELPPNFYIKGNRLVFPEEEMSESIDQTVSQRFSEPQKSSMMFDSGMLSSSLNQSINSCIDLRNKQKKESFNVRNTSHNFGPFRNKEGRKSSAFSASKGSSKPHKNSFQFGSKNPVKQSGINDYEEDNFDTKSFTHSKSIRIELEQKLDEHKKKNRKDSYKVKITTFHQYQMDDCNPNELFTTVPKNEEDVHQFFARQSPSKSEQQRHRPREQNQDCWQIPSPTTPKSAFIRKEPDHGYKSTTASTRTLEQKVKMAKQKAQIVLSRYLTSKKKAVSMHEQLDSWQ